MNKTDFFIITIIGALIAPFIICDQVFNTYTSFNANHGMITSFIKFAILATFGEMLALRIREGEYYKADFGVLPKFIIWGLLGLTIKMAFIIFATGVPNFLEYMGIKGAASALNNSNLSIKLLTAFSISLVMNVVYAPVMMLTHKITDMHIATHDGKTNSLIKPINIGSILKAIDWDVFWGFVLKKTIPFFWIPAHTITFLLPSDFRVLFAAILSIMLGLILSLATLKSKK